MLSEKNEPLDHDLMATIWEKAISIWIQVVIITLDL